MAYVYRGDLGPNWAQNTNRFLFTGVLNTFTDIVVYVFASRLIPGLINHVAWAKGFSYTISLLQSYLFNFILFPKQKPASIMPTIRFALLGIASISINTSVMFVAYNNMQIGELWSVVLATSVTFLWDFAVSKAFR
jgi:putative flippase GtrA